MKEKSYSGQILIVLMLALAIISVLLVLISRNVRRDTIDQIQSEQYETYYSSVEQEMLNAITGNNPQCTPQELNLGTCSIVLDHLQTGGTTATLNIVKVAEGTFTNLVIPKDKNIVIDLDDYKGDFVFSWKGEVAWVVNIDYRLPSGEYKTSQSIYDKFALFDDSSNIKNCLEFSDEGGNSFKFNLAVCLNKIAPSSSTTISLRMKPIIKTANITELTLEEPTSGLPPQVQIIRGTADIDDALPNSPRIQLELQIPIKNPPLEILDYALRTNKTVRKQTSP